MKFLYTLIFITFFNYLISGPNNIESTIYFLNQTLETLINQLPQQYPGALLVNTNFLVSLPKLATNVSEKNFKPIVETVDLELFVAATPFLLRIPNLSEQQLIEIKKRLEQEKNSIITLFPDEILINKINIEKKGNANIIIITWQWLKNDKIYAEEQQNQLINELKRILLPVGITEIENLMKQPSWHQDPLNAGDITQLKISDQDIQKINVILQNELARIPNKLKRQEISEIEAELFENEYRKILSDRITIKK